MTASSLTRACPLCSTPPDTAAKLNFGPREWPLLRCRKCKLVFLGRIPEYEELVEERAWERTSVLNAERRTREYPIMMTTERATRARLGICKRRPVDRIVGSAKPGPIIDLGCGKGDHLNPPPAGFTPFGIEISKGQARQAHLAYRTFGGKCICASAIKGLESFETNYFTAGLMIGYLEHEFNPRTVLTELNRVLVRNAPVVVKVPHFGSFNQRLLGRRWNGFRFPDHVNYFTRRTLAVLAESTGFEIECGIVDWALTSDSLWAVLRPKS
jgi:hypothetical protein